VTANNQRNYFVYILLCADGSLYTGITNNLAKRLISHNSGTASRYTRARLPVKLIYSELSTDRSGATKRECKIKNLSRVQKLSVVAVHQSDNLTF